MRTLKSPASRPDIAESHDELSILVELLDCLNCQIRGMACGDEGVAVGCDRHRCRLIEQVQALPPCPALPSAISPLPSAENITCNTRAVRGSALDHPDIAVST